MRIFERGQYLCGYLFIFAQILAIKEIAMLMFSALLIIQMIGYFKEGYRLHQIPFLMAAIGLGPLCVVD